MRHLGFVVCVSALLLACSSGPAAPTPGSQQTPGSQPTPPQAATSVPNPPAQQTPGAPQPNAGDNESRARALIPPGASEVGEASFGGAYQLSLTSTQSLEQLDAFWAQAIPAAGMQLTGRFTVEGTLTIAVSNPDGGIVAARDASTGVTTIVISLGTS